MKKIYLILPIMLFLSFKISANEFLLAELDSLAQLLVDNVDNNKNHCQLNISDSKNTLNALHAKLDEISKDLISNKNRKTITSLKNNCVKGCHCDFYLGLLENNKNDSEIKKIFDEIKSQSFLVNTKMKKSCISNSKKLCNSKLMRELIKDSKNFIPAPGI